MSGEQTVGLGDGATKAGTTTTKQTTAAAAPKKGRKGGTYTRNPRVVALAKISNLLDELDAESRKRVLRAVVEEYSELLNG
jgi:hypothetical protein